MLTFLGYSYYLMFLPAWTILFFGAVFILRKSFQLVHTATLAILITVSFSILWEYPITLFPLFRDFTQIHLTSCLMWLIPSFMFFSITYKKLYKVEMLIPLIFMTVTFYLHSWNWLVFHFTRFLWTFWGIIILYRLRKGLDG